MALISSIHLHCFSSFCITKKINLFARSEYGGETIQESQLWKLKLLSSVLRFAVRVLIITNWDQPRLTVSHLTEGPVNFMVMDECEEEKDIYKCTKTPPFYVN